MDVNDLLPAAADFMDQLLRRRFLWSSARLLLPFFLSVRSQYRGDDDDSIFLVL